MCGLHTYMSKNNGLLRLSVQLTQLLPGRGPYAQYMQTHIRTIIFAQPVWNCVRACMCVQLSAYTCCTQRVCVHTCKCRSVEA